MTWKYFLIDQADGHKPYMQLQCCNKNCFTLRMALCSSNKFFCSIPLMLYCKFCILWHSLDRLHSFAVQLFSFISQQIGVATVVYVVCNQMGYWYGSHIITFSIVFFYEQFSTIGTLQLLVVVVIIVCNTAE